MDLHNPLVKTPRTPDGRFSRSNRSQSGNEKSGKARSRRERMPAKVFSPEQSSKRERQNENLLRESRSLASIGGLDVTTESNRLLSRDPSFANFDYSCLHPREDPPQPQPEDEPIIYVDSSPLTSLPSSESTEISFNPLEFLVDNVKPLLSPLGSPTSPLNRSSTDSSATPTSSLFLLTNPNRSQVQTRPKFGFGFFRDPPPAPLPPSTFIFKSAFPTQQTPTIDPRLLSVTNSSNIYSLPQAAQSGMEPRKGMSMLLRIRNNDKNGGKRAQPNRGTKRKREEEDEEAEKTEED